MIPQNGGKLFLDNQLFRSGQAFDKIIILSMTGYNSISKQILKMGYDMDAIDASYVHNMVFAREQFVKDFGKQVEEMHLAGSVAEGGVYQGEFSAVINKVFPDRKLYLFDTFEGFDSRDIELEHAYEFSNSVAGHLGNTSVDLVKQKLEFPEKACFCKGYIPHSAKQVDDDFCFVNIDFDLYAPTEATLYFFWPEMVKGGIIVVHDYYYQGYKGIKACVDPFCRKVERVPFPIGDSISIAIQK